MNRVFRSAASYNVQTRPSGGFLIFAPSLQCAAHLQWKALLVKSDDIKKALNDYQKVIEGGNLADTFEKKEELKVKLVGIDSWDRPVYKDKSGNLYKDVNLGRGELDLHTAVNNDFYGEPDSPISDYIKVSVIKSFNKNKDRER